ncbi:large ribosomal subunit protein eL42-like [Myotis daubentonii]|uniref:large ribosomal subunit protein eL42-like n=1 Tax=Myotis daubentonii TaxID=98922 RepID=UPI002873AD6D|nr:large ribosomal subunit protein eL42-like [Myotis daubentonii]
METQDESGLIAELSQGRQSRGTLPGLTVDSEKLKLRNTVVFLDNKQVPGRALGPPDTCARALANIVNSPKTHRTFCKECGMHQPHEVTQYKKDKDSLFLQGKRCYDRKQSDYGGHTKPVFFEKAKTTKKIVLRLEYVEPKCRSKRMLAIKRCKHFELGGDKKRKGQVIQF